jgi:hypothetical protein
VGVGARGRTGLSVWNSGQQGYVGGVCWNRRVVTAVLLQKQYVKVVVGAGIWVGGWRWLIVEL